MKEMQLKQLKTLSPIALLIMTLAGCGQSGPLYLPKQKAEPNKQQEPATLKTDTQPTQTASKKDL